MRIALYQPAGPDRDPYPFGSSRVTALVAAALRLAGHEVERIAAGTGEASGDGIDRLAADLTPSGRPRPDVWISSRIDGRSGDGIGRAVCAALGIPHILLQPDIGRAAATGADGGSTIPAQAIAAANATFALSGAYAAKIAETLPEQADRLIVLPPFIDLDPVQPVMNSRQSNRTLLALKHQLPTDRPWLVAAGPMATGDDLDSFRRLAQAMTPLTDLKWHLIVAGAGARRTEVGALLGRMPMRNHRVLAVETPADLLALMSCGDLFVWPSTDESLPLAVLEAQAVGLAVVAGRTAALEEVVGDGRTGMLVKPGNAPSLGNAIGFLLRHPDFRRTYAEQGPKWIGRYFDMRAVVPQLDATLRRVVRLAGLDGAALPVQAVDRSGNPQDL